MTREPSIPDAVLGRIRAPFAAFAETHGARWVAPPLLQPLGLLLDLTGEALRSRLILVSSGQEDLALRPDFTIPVVRGHIESGEPIGRYVYAGDAYRTPEPSRAAEFFQLGLEILGDTEDPAAEDGAVVGLAYSAAAAGGRGDLGLRFGDIGLFKGFLTAIGLNDSAIQRLVRALPNPRALARELDRADSGDDGMRNHKLAAMLADLPEAEAASMLEELWRLAGIQPVGGRTPAEIVHRLALRADAARNPALSHAEVDLIRRYLAISAPIHDALGKADRIAAEAGGDLSHLIEAWMQRLSAMSKSGAPPEATLSTAFARPFGYYDGVLFEIASPSVTTGEPIAGGGRYDSLPERLGGRPGAVGCMVRPALAWRGA
jgi:ATP phosphoribosyltransferase regulatory subunit